MEDVFGYRQAAPVYRRAGWTQVVPLPPAAKSFPPKGVTGRRQQPVTDRQIQEWSQSNQDGNTAIVMPRGVICLDVDSAEGHQRKTDGALELAELEQRLGVLPATWCSSAHGGESPYRHRFYRVPEGIEFDGGAAESIDVIQHHHRYCVVWPSVHPSGEFYAWYTPEGRPADRIPTPNELPALPEAWVRFLRKPEREERPRPTGPAIRPNLGDDTRMCKAVNTLLRRTLENPAAKGSRHDTMLHTAWAFVRFQEEGHRGALDALSQLKPYFITDIAKDRQGGEREAEREYASIVQGALEKNAGSQGLQDPCERTLIDRLTPDEATLINRQATAPMAAAPESDHATDDGLPVAQAVQASSTWRFEDLTQLARGVDIPPTHTVFQREDGQGLFYQGAVNDVHGEPGCGKSLAMQAATAQQLKQGNHVLYVDYEDTARNVVKRLLLMGVSAEAIVERLHYVRPSGKNTGPTSVEGWLETIRLASECSLTVIDGVTSCLAYQGLDSNNGDDIAAWYNTYPRLLSQEGTAVVLIDHVVKSKDNRGRYAGGSMQKLALIDGISYSVSMSRPVGKGLRGTITLKSGKDRIGEIEEHCATTWSGNGSHLREAARIDVDSTDPQHMRVQICRPNMMPVSDGESEGGHVDRPTGLMEKISRLVEASGDELSQSDIISLLKDDGSSARKTTVLKAISRLVEDEYLSSRGGRYNQRLYSSVRSYRQIDDPKSDAYVDRMSRQEMNDLNDGEGGQDAFEI